MNEIISACFIVCHDSRIVHVLTEEVKKEREGTQRNNMQERNLQVANPVIPNLLEFNTHIC